MPFLRVSSFLFVWRPGSHAKLLTRSWLWHSSATFRVLPSSSSWTWIKCWIISQCVGVNVYYWTPCIYLLKRALVAVRGRTIQTVTVTHFKLPIIVITNYHSGFWNQPSDFHSVLMNTNFHYSYKWASKGLLFLLLKTHIHSFTFENPDCSASFQDKLNSQASLE